MDGVDVRQETEMPRGWRYVVQIRQSAGDVSEHEVSLSWVDHDLWSGGRRPPSMVIEAVIKRVLQHRPAALLPARFDAARARWWVDGFDQELRAAL